MILASVMTTFSQEAITTTTTTTTTSTAKSKISGRKNELKIDLFSLIFRPALNLSYERLINDESAFGASLFINGEKVSDNNIMNNTFSFAPYYRFYFGKKPAAGFFFEGFTAINSFENQKFVFDNNYNYGYAKTNETDLALGLGLGGKWITNNGIIFELYSGVGRNMLKKYGGKDGLNSFNEIYVRGGLTVGYRF